MEEEFAMKNDESDTYSSPAVEKCLDAILRKLDSAARFDLMDRRFQLAVVPFSLGTDLAWAYFPVHHRREIARHIEIRPEARVLLVIFEPEVERFPYEETMKKLRHHFGHVLRYLRAPKSKNDCSDAVMEWKKSRR